MTLQRALKPQAPGHGSRHFCAIHARSLGHSEFTVHSGRQLGGTPMYVDRQVHDGLPPMSRHSANWPQGDGTHGFL